MDRLRANLQSYYGGKIPLAADKGRLGDLMQPQKGQLMISKYKTAESVIYARRREFKERKLRN